MISWNGGSRPVPAGTTVGVVQRNGRRLFLPAEQIGWGHADHGEDIVAYEVWNSSADLDKWLAANRRERTSAESLLNAAAAHMRDRAATYDQQGGERSMRRAVEAFNAITGQSLTEVQGWEFMAVLKAVRFHQNPTKPHRDSIEDAIAYRALMGEAALAGGCAAS